MVETYQKMDYVAPVLTVVGTFETITQGSSDGEDLDAAFPVGTPRGELTFS